MKHALTTELLLLPDGRILVHNLTQTFADLLSQLNPDDLQIQPRTRRATRITQHASRLPPHELSD